MLKSWSLESFKSIYDNTKFNISPLTIFTGANSSGKSSVIQSILLTAQTLQNNIHSKSIVLNGSIVKLGNFYDVLSYQEDKKSIKIGFELESNMDNLKKHSFFIFEDEDILISEKKVISCDFEFSTEDDSDIASLHPLITKSHLAIYNRNENKVISEISIAKTPMSIDEKLEKYKVLYSGERSKEALKYDVTSNSTSNKNSIGDLNFGVNRLTINEKYIGAELLHFIPNRIISRIDKNEITANKILYYLSDPDSEFDLSDAENLLNPLFIKKITEILDVFLENIGDLSLGPNRGMKNWERLQANQERLHANKERFLTEKDFKAFKSFYYTLSASIRREWTNYLVKYMPDLINLLIENVKPQYALISSRTNAPINNHVDEIEEYFNNKVKYLGPLRDEPKPIYPNSGALDSKDVGFRGEYTAAVLDLHKDTIINYISPYDLDSKEYTPKKDKLLNAVLEWINYMGISKNVQTLDKGKLGHELQVQLNGEGKFHDLTNVGVGVSQVLPILVLTLLAEKNSTIIFEQPELHLHPKVQTKLADFFVTMIQLNKQCIIETHSEYLINRLRFKAVSSEKDNITDNVIIYFVEQEEGKSKYRAIEINEYGVIEEWPKGFFDEHEKSATEILKAARKKSRGR